MSRMTVKPRRNKLWYAIAIALVTIAGLAPRWVKYAKSIVQVQKVA